MAWAVFRPRCWSGKKRIFTLRLAIADCGLRIVGEGDFAIAVFGGVPEPEEEFVSEEVFGLWAFRDPGVFGLLGFAVGALDEARGAEVFVVAFFAGGFEEVEGE
jgi:hypothetical protein